MTEDILEKLPINAVFDLMTQSKEDLLAARNKNDKTAINASKEEVELLQKFLVSKRIEFLPG
jgi:hypothetical protein